jgi:signal transduction histidine kinase
VAATLERLGPTVKSALAELRRISMNLRPSTLDDLGILATLSWYFREFEAACPKMTLDRDIRVKECDVPELLKIAIFRIVQEATGNALKHAAADRIRVCLSNERDTLELLIEDTGRGFDPAAAAGRRNLDGGLGLQSMKERAELSGASYEIQSAPGKGTSICVRWPSLGTFERNLAALPQSSVHFMHQPTPPDRRLPQRFSHCLACMNGCMNGCMKRTAYQ